MSLALASAGGTGSRATAPRWSWRGPLARFMQLPRFWVPEAGPGAVVGREHAHFEGHIHATARGLWGLLEYADLANDERLKSFVRDGYEYIRSFGIARIGLFGETCTVGDMTSLAVRLSDAGVGDYWEDVDQYARNHLAEMQILDPAPIAAIAAASPRRRGPPVGRSRPVRRAHPGLPVRRRAASRRCRPRA